MSYNHPTTAAEQELIEASMQLGLVRARTGRFRTPLFVRCQERVANALIALRKEYNPPPIEKIIVDSFEPIEEPK